MAPSSSKRRGANDKLSSSSGRSKNKDFAQHKKFGERHLNKHLRRNSNSNNNVNSNSSLHSNSNHQSSSYGHDMNHGGGADGRTSSSASGRLAGSGNNGSSSNSSSRKNSSGHSSSHRSSSSNSNSHYQNNHGSSNSHYSSGNNNSNAHNSSSDGNGRNKSHHHPNLSHNNGSNTNTNSHNQNQNQSSTSPTNGTNTRVHKPLDPTLLARGMTARAIGSRVSSSIKTLSAFDIEKDIRHMEAYGAACIAYAQQFFAYTNRDLVNSGHYGPVGVAPNVGVGMGVSMGMGMGTAGGGMQSMSGVAVTDSISGGGASGIVTPSGDISPNNITSSGGDAMQGGQPQNSSSQPHQHQQQGMGLGMGGITMPVRIDPEEEKRLAILRSRVAASEAKREVLETEYMSLRAHYVHESHKLRRARMVVTGQLRLLGDLVKRRGAVLALYRVRYALANDILHSLEYRSKALKRKEADLLNSNNHNYTSTNTVNEVNSRVGGAGADLIPDGIDDKGNTSTAMEGVEYSTGTTTTPTSSILDKNNNSNNKNGTENHPNMEKTKLPISTTKTTPDRDMGEVWDMIETQLQEAEHTCTNKIETPEELLEMKAALAADAAALEAATEKASLGNGSGSGSGSSSTYQRRAKSPSRPEDDADDTTAGGGGGGSGGSGGGKKKNGDKSSKSKKGGVDDGATSGASERDGAGGSGSGTKKSLRMDTDPNLIPWKCPVLSRTPYDVAILLSNLSTAPDGAAAFACGDCNGHSSDSLLWLEANLPNSQKDEMEKEEERLLKAREKVKALSDELSREVKANSDLQRDFIKGRKRRDQLCAMMSMIRSETEAVLERYNEVLETPAAIAEVEALHGNDNHMDESIDYEGMENIDEYDDGELGDGENSEEGTVIEGDVDDDQDDFGGVSTLNDSASDTYDDDNGQPMKEITVPRIETGEENESISTHNAANKRGYQVASEDSIVDSEKKRRKV